MLLHDVFLRDHLDTVGNGLKQAEGADTVGADTILYASQPFALQPSGEGKAKGEHGSQGNRGE